MYIYVYSLLNRSYQVQTWTVMLQRTGSKGPMVMGRKGLETGLPLKDKQFIRLLQLKPSHLERKRRKEAEIGLGLGSDSTRFTKKIVLDYERGPHDQSCGATKNDCRAIVACQQEAVEAVRRALRTLFCCINISIQSHLISPPGFQLSLHKSTDLPYPNPIGISWIKKKVSHNTIQQLNRAQNMSLQLFGCFFVLLPSLPLEFPEHSEDNIWLQ